MISIPNINLRVNGSAVCRKLGDDHYLVPISGDLASTGHTVRLNGTGAILWDKISHSSVITLPDLVGYTASEYKISEETALHDIQAFLDTLVNIGIISLEQSDSK